MKYFIILFLFLLIITINETAKILFTFYHDRGSHFGSMLSLMEKLAIRGHSVYVLDTIYPNNKSSLINYHRAYLPQDDEKEEIKKAFAYFFWYKTDSSVTLPEFFEHGDDKLEILMLNYTQKIVELINENWDLIIIDDLFWTFGFALTTLQQRIWEKSNNNKIKNEPKSIIYSTAGQTLISSESIKSTGNNWVSKCPLFPFIPNNINDGYTSEKFSHRLHAFFENGAEYLLMNLIVEQFYMPNIARFGVPNFSWKELYFRSSLQLSDSIDRLGWPLAKGPEMINIGAHCKKPRKLPEEFKKFIEEDSEGLIYAAFGTYPEWSLAPKRIISSLIGAFQRLDKKYKIIFTYNGPPIKNIGKNIMLTKWAPQLEILAHPMTKAFITHGGLKSIREGLCSGVPLIVMPLFAEQAHNAQQILVMGIGPVINKYTLNINSVYSTINSVISDPKRIIISKKFRSIFLDRIIPALDEGTFWLERITRLKPGRKVYFQRKGINLNWINFLYFDLIIFLFFIFILLIF